jgi:short-chain fatty acids transporter
MQHLGLADLIFSTFVNLSTPETLVLWTFLSGGLVDFFVPSGGGRWVVQGPIMLKAALELGGNPARVSMALAWGDAWVLPLIAMAGLKLKDIMGYCLVYLIFSGLLISCMLLWA